MDSTDSIDNALEKWRSARLKKKSNKLQQTVYSNSNPSPILIAVIVLMVVIITYWVYLKLRSDINGTWVDKNNNKWDIVYNDLYRTFVACQQNTDLPVTKNGIALCRTVLDIEGQTALWDCANCIYFISNNNISDVWHRVIIGISSEN